MGLDLKRLESDSERAQLMWDYMNNPRALVAELTMAVAETLDSTGVSLDETQCGSYSAVIGAAMMLDVYNRTMDPTAPITAYDITEAQSAAAIIEHAGNTHHDTFADAVLGVDGSPTFTETVRRIQAWVADNLVTQLAEVIELFPNSADFAQWEA